MQVIDDGLSIIRKLWDAGLAHRDIKPANLLVRDGHLLLIDAAFVEARPSPWRQAVDLANMMLCLALRSSPEVVYQRALRQFSVQEISEAFAPLTLPGFAHTPWVALGLALPSQLRRKLRDESRDLYAEFVRLLPTPPQPIRIQRWSARRIGLALLAVLGLVIVLPAFIYWSVRTDRVNTSLYVSDVGCTSQEPLWLMAQSVPSAALVPCVRNLPAGWSLADIQVQDGHSRITFDTDRAGKAAVVVELAASCDLAGAVEVTSEQPGARRYLRIEGISPRSSATRFHAFGGGCITERFTAPAASHPQLASEGSSALGFTTREELGRALKQRSGGRLQLV